MFTLPNNDNDGGVASDHNRCAGAHLFISMQCSGRVLVSYVAVKEAILMDPEGTLAGES